MGRGCVIGVFVFIRITIGECTEEIEHKQLQTFKLILEVPDILELPRKPLYHIRNLFFSVLIGSVSAKYGYL